MQPIFNLRKKRDFGEVISDTIQYTRKHFKPLLRAVMIIAGPFLLLASIYSSVSQVNLISFGGDTFGDNIMLNTVISNLFLSLAVILLFTVVHDYMKIAMMSKDETEIKVEEVWQLVKTDIWKSVGIVILYVLLIGVLALFYFLIYSILGPVFFGFMLFIGIFFFIYFFFRFSYVFPAALLDNYSVYNSFIRSWQLSYGYFWVNFGLSFVFSFMIGIISTLAAVPFLILTFMVAFHGGNYDINPIWKLIVIIIQTTGLVIAYTAYAVYAIAFVIQYYSVAEKLEGTGLMEKIENMKLTKEDPTWGEETY